jgi:hypothetical protein
MDGTPGNSDVPGRLEFKTTPDGSNSQRTRMTIKSDGKVGIGTETPSELLSVSGNLTTATGIANTIRMNSLAFDPNPVQNGDCWYRNDYDFRARSNSQTMVDALNSMIQCRHTTGTAQQNCNTAGGVAVNWNAEDVKDAVYTHNNSTNSSRITVSQTAWYRITYSVAWASTDVRRKTVQTRIRKNGSTYLTVGKVYGNSYNATDAEGSNSATALVRLTANDYVEVMANQVGSAGTADTDQTDGCWITLEFVRWGS